MIIPNKCKTCINRNSEKCPLNKKSKKPCELIEDEAVDQAEATEKESLMNKSAQFVQNATAATKRITGELFRKMLMNAGASIKKNAEKINDLNVFPVPDGDTGSNMSMTIGSAVNDLKKTEKAEVGDLANLTASAMLRGARGNSGVILSLLFRGISKELQGATTCDGVTWANALRSGVDAAYKAVTSPAEGTILTVARVAAERAEKAAAENNDFEYVLEAATVAANEALDNTIEQNPVLKKAGVVDAGGMGWVVALTAMLDALHGKELAIDDKDDVPEARANADFTSFNTEDIKFTYCTEFIVSRENDKDPDTLRDYLSTIGDSLVVVSDDEIIKVHVHTNEPGNAMQRALEYGSFMTVKVENMKLQHTEKVAAPEEAKPAIAVPTKEYGVVAVCAGDGIAETFVSLGVDQTVSGGQTMNPSTEDILNAVNSVPAETVFVLPNNKNIILAAEQAAAICEKKLVVIPTRSTPQGIAAMQRFDEQLSADEIAEGMKEGAESADTIQITYAARNSEFDGLHISEGEYLALYENKLAGNGEDLDALLFSLAEKAKSRGKELITIYYGADVAEQDAEDVLQVFSEAFDEDSVMLVNGGQPVYYYIISAE